LEVIVVKYKTRASSELNRAPPGPHPLKVRSLAELGDRWWSSSMALRLCNRTVRWLLRRDRRDQLRFVASESEMALAAARHGINSPDAESGLPRFWLS